MIDPSSERRIDALKSVIANLQILAIKEGLKGEESAYFHDLLSELEVTIQNCPTTYDTDGQGDEAKCVLHYFSGNSDFYVVGLDAYGPPHIQAYGFAVLNRGHPELGYFDLETLIRSNFELDFHYTQQTVGEVMKKHRI